MKQYLAVYLGSARERNSLFSRIYNVGGFVEFESGLVDDSKLLKIANAQVMEKIQNYFILILALIDLLKLEE